MKSLTFVTITVFLLALNFTGCSKTQTVSKINEVVEVKEETKRTAAAPQQTAIPEIYVYASDGKQEAAEDVVPSTRPKNTGDITTAIELMPAQDPILVPKLTPEPTPEYSLYNLKDYRGVVKGHDVNLREGPGTEYDIISVADFDSKITVKAKCEDWLQIKYGDVIGFMLNEFVDEEEQIPDDAKPKSPSKTTPAPVRQKPDEAENAEEIEQGDAGNFTEEEIYLVAQLIYREGGGGDTQALRAIANVLLNRCNSPKFGGTIEEEIFRKNQFSVANNRTRFLSAVPSSKCIEAAKDVFNSGIRVLPENVMFFRAARLGKNWGRREYYAALGGNAFFS